MSVAPNANAGQRARIDELTKIVKEKDKEIESLHEIISNKVTSAYGADLMAKSIQFFLEKENHELKQHQTQLAIQELEKVKVSLKDRISMIENEEHSYLQKVVTWYDICDQINNQIKELKGNNDEPR